MDLTTIDSGWVAFLAGIITSPHCILMCGPLAFVLLTPRQNGDLIESKHSYFIPHTLYHITRISSFTILGAIAGAVGFELLKVIQIPAIKLLPWALVIFLLVFAIGLDRLIPKVPFAKRILAGFSEKLSQLNKYYAGALLGLTTPLLPCGPLYMVLWVALISGSPLFGAEISFGFALGTIPLMFIAGKQYSKLESILKPQLVHRIQRGLALLGAFFLIWRLTMTGGPITGIFCCPWS